MTAISVTDTRCGVYHRTEYREAKGPRGGKRMDSRIVCVQCGQASPWVSTNGPRYLNDERVAAVREHLLATKCLKPISQSSSSRMLTRLAAVILAGKGIPLPFEVEFLFANGASVRVADAAIAAWNECDDGYAMGSFIVSRHRGVYSLDDDARCRNDGSVDVKIAFTNVKVHLTGTRGGVATMLRNSVARSTVRSTALLAEPVGDA